MTERVFLLGIVMAVCLLLLPGVAFAQTRPNTSKKWRRANPPKMVVFGDSISDAGRRFNAPASFRYREYSNGLGSYPFKRLYDDGSSLVLTQAYMPNEGSVTNGDPWTGWLFVPEELNYATSSATATETFRSLETCIGYTGEDEDFPTGTLEEQIDRYQHEYLHKATDLDTLDYTHVIMLGSNDVFGVIDAITRYSIGGAGYSDPIDFFSVFELDPATGTPSPTFEPMITEVIAAWDAGILRLIESGVTGRILLSNVSSPKAFGHVFGEQEVLALDMVTQALKLGAEQLVEKYYPQVRMLDMYALFAALVDNPSVFTDLDFTADGGDITDSCMKTNFFVDAAAEIMVTQGQRDPGCQEECALCADNVSPCQNCLTDNPAIVSMCEDTYTWIFYDDIHFTTDFHVVFGDAIRECAEDEPDPSTALVSILCPDADN